MGLTYTPDPQLEPADCDVADRAAPAVAVLELAAWMSQTARLAPRRNRAPWLAMSRRLRALVAQPDPEEAATDDEPTPLESRL